MTRLAAAWDRHWFAPASLTDLAMMRLIVLGLLLLLNGTSRFLIVGSTPVDQYLPTPLVGGIDKPDLETMRTLGLATACLLTLGFFGIGTRAALVIAAPLLFVQEALLMSVGKPAHAAIPALWATLFLALAPCDRRLSVRALAWGRARALPERSDFARWPIELAFVVLAGFYFAAGCSKLLWSGVAWADGATLQYHLLRAGTPLGIQLAEWPAFCAAGSAIVLAWELAFPLGISRRLRPYVLAGGLVFHLATGLLLSIWFWPVVALYLVFLPWSRIRFERASHCG